MTVDDFVDLKCLNKQYWLQRTAIACLSLFCGDALSMQAQTPGQQAPTDGIPGQNLLGLRGSLYVDENFGVAGLTFALGPGIGGMGLRYDPILQGHFAPLVGSAPLANSLEPARESVLATALIATTGFMLTPGTLDLQFGGEGVSGDLVGGMSMKWTYPNGESGNLLQCSGGSCDARALLLRFGYAATGNGGFLPHVLGPSDPVSTILAGTGGALVLGLPNEEKSEGQTILKVKEDEWGVPSGVLVIRGQTSYRFLLSEIAKNPAGGPLGLVHYRLAAIRNENGEEVTFAYGSNGVDFEAKWKTVKVSVVLDGVVPIAPSLALDDALSPLDPDAPSIAFRNTVARVRIIYEGLPSPLSYAITALARTEFRTPDGAFVGGFHTAGGTMDPFQDSFRRNLQVNTLRKEGTGEMIRFRYGKASHESGSGANDGQGFSATVLEEIAYRGRKIRMKWETMAPLQVRGGGRRDSMNEGPASVGVSLVEDWDLSETKERVVIHAVNGVRGTDAPLVGETPPIPEVRVEDPCSGASTSVGGEQGLFFLLSTRSDAPAQPSDGLVGTPGSGGIRSVRAGLRGGAPEGLGDAFPSGVPFRPLNPPSITPPTWLPSLPIYVAPRVPFLPGTPLQPFDSVPPLLPQMPQHPLFPWPSHPGSALTTPPAPHFDIPPTMAQQAVLFPPVPYLPVFSGPTGSDRSASSAAGGSVVDAGSETSEISRSVAGGDYKQAFAQLAAQANKQKIRDLQVKNDSMKTQLDTQAVRDYLTTVGTETIRTAVMSGVIFGEAGAAIGAVLGFGVGGPPIGGVGAAGGAIIAGVGALSYSGVTEGIKLQQTLNTIKSNWEANYRAIQNYSDINCIGNPPEIRY